MIRLNWLCILLAVAGTLVIDSASIEAGTNDLPYRNHVIGKFSFFEEEHSFEYWREGEDLLLELEMSHGVREVLVIQDNVVFHFSKIPRSPRYLLISNFSMKRFSEEEFSKQIGGLSASTYLSFADPEWYFQQRIAQETELGARVTEKKEGAGTQQTLTRPESKQVISVWREEKGKVDRIEFKGPSGKTLVGFEYNENGLQKLQETRPGGLVRSAVYISRDNDTALKIDLSKYDYAQTGYYLPIGLVVFAIPILGYVFLLFRNRYASKS